VSSRAGSRAGTTLVIDRVQEGHESIQRMAGVSPGRRTNHVEKPVVGVFVCWMAYPTAEKARQFVRMVVTSQIEDVLLGFLLFGIPVVLLQRFQQKMDPLWRPAERNESSIRGREK